MAAEDEVTPVVVAVGPTDDDAADPEMDGSAAVSNPADDDPPLLLPPKSFIRDEYLRACVPRARK